MLMTGKRLTVTHLLAGEFGPSTDAASVKRVLLMDLDLESLGLSYCTGLLTPGAYISRVLLAARTSATE